MKKVLFTESQMRQILNKMGLNEWSEISSGYLNQNSPGTEAPSNIGGSKVTVDTVNPEDEEQENVTTTDDFARTLSPRGRNFGFGSKYTQPVTEDIEQQVFRPSEHQKSKAQAGGTKMGKNIANEKTTSNATQRKRKERLNDKKKELTHDQFKQRYGAIDKIVNSSLKQMSNINDTLTNISDTNKLTNANDVTKVKTTTKRGHHDGEELSNGTLHYFK
jgi:hypothetical protein